MPSITNIPGVSTASNGLGDGTTRVPNKVLGQEDFLKLLITQLSQQDPMNPQKDTEFIAQMASFSALEQSKAMHQDMAQLRASALLGDTVELKGPLNTTITGVVQRVEFADGKPTVIVGGVRYQMSDILSVTPTAAAAPTSTNTPVPVVPTGPISLPIPIYSQITSE